VRQSADVVIVGGGIIGCATAYYLAQRGCTNVVVLERNTIGSGSTSRAAGGIRVQFSTPIHIQFTLRSVPVWARFKEEFGVDVDYRQWGYLFLAGDEAELETYRQTTALQRSFGGEVELIGPDDVARLVPGLRTDDLLGAAWGPKDGFADPNSACQGFAAAAKRLGVEIVEGADVTAVEAPDGKVEAVVSNQGRVTTGKVLNAAGPWAGQLAALNGIDLPLMPINRQIFLTRPRATLPRELPLIINSGRGLSMRRESADTIGLSVVNDEQPSTLEPSVDYDYLPNILPKAVHRLPALAEAELVGGYAGIIEHTPDKHSVLDRLPEIDGYFLAFGFSGHGFQHSPIVGQVMAEMILDGQVSSIDLSPLRLSRFAEGQLNEELMIMLKPKWPAHYTERLVRDVAPA
jgi:glycine/D-amino acid oxidase-like deaminating enzyme